MRGVLLGSGVLPDDIQTKGEKLFLVKSPGAYLSSVNGRCKASALPCRRKLGDGREETQQPPTNWKILTGQEG